MFMFTILLYFSHLFFMTIQCLQHFSTKLSSNKISKVFAQHIEKLKFGVIECAKILNVEKVKEKKTVSKGSKNLI